MGETLKEQNRNWLRLVVVLNIAAYSLVLSQGVPTLASVAAIVASWQRLVPGTVGAIFTVVLVAALSPTAKARLVFWRWHHALPGHRAFTVYAQTDPRVDISGLEKRLGALPREPMAENRAWFQLYKPLQKEPAVEHAHREYLFFRDYAALAAIALVALGTASVAYVGSVASLYLVLLAVQYLLARTAASNAGARFVTAVLAHAPMGDGAPTSNA